MEEENNAEVGDVPPRVKPDEMTSFVTRRIRCLSALQSDIPSKVSLSESVEFKPRDRVTALVNDLDWLDIDLEISPSGGPLLQQDGGTWQIQVNPTKVRYHHGHPELSWGYSQQEVQIQV